jgi:hypothetical protein
MTDHPPAARANPADLVAAGVQRFLDLARTWLAWDGRPLVSEDGDRVYTPNKAVRRDRPRDPDWTLRAIAEHLAEPWYAEQVGDLSVIRARRPG